MTRKEFIKVSSLLGLSLPFQNLLTACRPGEINENFKGKVIIIGAGAGGLTAGYLLQQIGADFEILEASNHYGGRMKQTIDFADFPVPLGAEWLHVERGVFDEIVNDSNIRVEVETTPYDLDNDKGLFEGEEITVKEAGFTIDQKFINSTWFDFYEQYVVPSVKDKIRYQTVVKSIDYTGDQVLVQTDDQDFTADKVVISVPVKMLQRGMIAFSPALPEKKAEAIQEVTVWDGCKAFIEFSEKFYPTFIGFDIQPESDGEKLYYDAAYGQDSERHILGLFAVGTGTLPYVELSDQELIDYMLTELDELYDNRASASYMKHTFQTWNKEPFINGAYITSHENWRRVRRLGDSVADKLYFAGTSYTNGLDWGSVHTPARSALQA
ncbi:MAG: FAD-dependent oxidoreductase, partial [Bacteroidota bacterium]